MWSTGGHKTLPSEWRARPSSGAFYEQKDQDKPFAHQSQTQQSRTSQPARLQTKMPRTLGHLLSSQEARETREKEESVCWWLFQVWLSPQCCRAFVNLTPAGVIWEEWTSTEKVTPQNWLVEHFLDWLMIGVEESSPLWEVSALGRWSWFIKDVVSVPACRSLPWMPALTSPSDGMTCPPTVTLVMVCITETGILRKALLKHTLLGFTSGSTLLSLSCRGWILSASAPETKCKGQWVEELSLLTHPVPWPSK